MTIRSSGLSRFIAATLAATVIATTAACSDGDSNQAAVSAAVVERDLESYDAFVIASAENNPLFADVYGIRFGRLTADRITADKRISTMGADAKHLFVAAADTDVDRLAVVNGNGTLTPVPGLGRPYAFSPEVDDGVLYYQVSLRDDADRFFSYDLTSQERTRLFDSGGLSGMIPAGEGVFVHGRPAKDIGGALGVVIRSSDGKRQTFSMKEDVFGLAVGREWIASTATTVDGSFGEDPEALVLLNRKSGAVRRVAGLQAICWTPDGTRLLARRTTSPGASDLVLLDPAKPDQLTEVGSIPNLVIYSGTWVRNNP